MNVIPHKASRIQNSPRIKSLTFSVVIAFYWNLLPNVIDHIIVWNVATKYVSFLKYAMGKILSTKKNIFEILPKT